MRLAVAAVPMALACAGPEPTPTPSLCSPAAAERSAPAWAPSAEPPNVLLVLVDDVGVDLIGAYGVDPAAPPTPNIDALAAQGVRFDRAYATPWCSPSRAALLTGLLARRMGIGLPIDLPDASVGLPGRLTTLPELLRDEAPTPMQTAMFGKWHLTGDIAAAAAAPLEHGFDWFQGMLSNFLPNEALDGNPMGYFNWEKSDNGEVQRVTGYATTVTADDAITWIGQAAEPWFAYASFNAGHVPFHDPPEHLHGYPLGTDDLTVKARAMVEALDTEIGRMLDSIPPAVRARTLVVLMGDNGTPRTVVVGEDRHGKGSIYEGGIRVPLIVAGPGVATGRVDSLIDITDVFPTVAELLGADVDHLALDGVSFAPLLADPDGPPVRDWVFSEWFSPHGQGPYDVHYMAIRDDRYKLVRYTEEELYDLRGRDWEGAPLTTAPDAADALGDRLDLCFGSTGTP